MNNPTGGNNVTPKTFLIGYTVPDMENVQAYLKATGQEAYWIEFAEAYTQLGPSALVSLFAKLCYKSLVTGKNPNITRTRNTEDNLKASIEHGHGSVWEHLQLNFVTTDVSRVFTHELVRHRVGMAFSQTSGRYVAIDKLDLVLPPEIRDNPEAMKIVNNLRAVTEEYIDDLRQALIPDDADFATKKKLTSAIRRLAPNGQSNEIGWSCNVRSLRHLIEMRTSRHAEWEIRYVFNQVATIIRSKWPIMLHGGAFEYIDGLQEWTGLGLSPVVNTASAGKSKQ